MIEDDDEGGGGDSAPWMATFADLMSLLLTFFILLLSFATMDIVEFQEALGSMREAFGVQFVHSGSHEAVADDPIQIFDSEKTPEMSVIQNQSAYENEEFLEELREAIAEQQLDGRVDATIEEGRGVILRISGEVLYGPGAAYLREEALPILERVSDLIAGRTYRIVVEGHTDDLPINTVEFPSNWELSTARAISAMRYLVALGVEPARVGVAGYADFRPLEPNDTPEHRAVNRRVEFVFVLEGGRAG